MALSGSGVLDFDLSEAFFNSTFLAFRFISSNLGMAFMTSSLEAPRSVSKVVMLVKKFSAAVLCLSRANSWFFRCFRTELTWLLAKVGGKLACNISRAVMTLGMNCGLNLAMLVSEPMQVIRLALLM